MCQNVPKVYQKRATKCAHICTDKNSHPDLAGNRFLFRIAPERPLFVLRILLKEKNIHTQVLTAAPPG